MKRFLFSAAIFLGAAGAVWGQELTDAVSDGVAAARAQASVKEAFSRQRAAGLSAKADTAAIEAWLRLQMRANTASLRFGSRWRQYPDDAAFRNRAYLTGQELEKLVAGLGPVRTWTCSYDRKASLLMNGAIGPLIVSANAKLYAQPPVPPYTGAESAYRSGPVPPVAEAEPAVAKSSAGWLDWAAASALHGSLEKMRDDRALQETDKSTATVLSPDRAQVREAIRLWRLAAALEKGAPAPRLSAAKLDAAADGVLAAVAGKYGGAELKELQDCGFEDFVAAQTGRAAKRLLPRPKAGAKRKKK